VTRRPRARRVRKFRAAAARAFRPRAAPASEAELGGHGGRLDRRGHDRRRLRLDW